jgi:pimeloyl-ACP methyl ester carboxylesterase
MRPFAWLTAFLSVLALAVAVVQSAAAQPTHRSVPASFHPMACPDHTFPPDADVDCGYIVVPENRADPDGRQIRVAAAIVHASAPRPAADPIVFLDGGPSFGAISDFAFGAYFAGARFAAKRDVVLVDTRGTGLSTPRLGCPELDRAEVRAFYAPPTINSQVLPLYTAALRHCHDRFTDRGIDLAAYNSAESAADLEALRRALGGPRWDVVAFSADGTLALTYMRSYPGGVRTAVIDSGMSTQMLWGLDYDRGRNEQLDKIFAGCAANAACRAAYPHLRALFYAKARQLQRHPIDITLPAFQPHPVTLHLDGVGLFADVLYDIFPGNKFAPSSIPYWLDRMWQETHGHLVAAYRDAFGTGPAENGHRDDFFAQGKTLSYVCHDSVNFITEQDLRDAAHDLPFYAARYLDPDYDLADNFNVFISPAGCRIWDVGVASARQHEPTRSGVPTLVLAGEYDGGVPAYIVRQVMVGLPNGRYYEFPAGAHGQLAFYNYDSHCARGITAQFLRSPRGAIDSSCIADLAGIDFTPSSG